jgi:hypothetical protein
MGSIWNTFAVIGFSLASKTQPENNGFEKYYLKLRLK